jgi:hypothetical protein
MKQRITFIQPEGTGIDPNGIHVNPDTVVFSNARSAALEKRLTLGLEDLPAEVGRYHISLFSNKSTADTLPDQRNPRAMPRTAHPLVRPRRPRHPSTFRLPPPSRSTRLLHAPLRRRRSEPLPSAPETLRRGPKMLFDDGKFYPPLAALRDILLRRQLPVLPRPAQPAALQPVPAS